ncbi:hypothetical protein PINS_up013816 [Pythium insidiosum]|nr:hypothetical protein PINS_up013816 [Pythium insidiosum]
MIMTTMMRPLGTLLLLLLATAGAQETGVPGGWSTVEMAPAHEHTLLNALAKRDANSEPHICVTQLTAVEQQVVAGTNYRFHVQGCRVKAGSNGKHRAHCRAPCTMEAFVVQVWEQSWTDTLEVTSVETEKTAVVALQAIEDDEKEQILQWIKDKGLNEYGDGKDTMYTGGTPLFDETSGKHIDRFEYILKRHPGRPWNDVDMATHMRSSAHAHGAKALELSAAGSSSKSNTQRDIAIAAGTFSVLGAVIVLVALSKRRQSETRRFTYQNVSCQEL